MDSPGLATTFALVVLSLVGFGLRVPDACPAFDRQTFRDWLAISALRRCKRTPTDRLGILRTRAQLHQGSPACPRGRLGLSYSRSDAFHALPEWPRFLGSGTRSRALSGREFPPPDGLNGLRLPADLVPPYAAHDFSVAGLFWICGPPFRGDQRTRFESSRPQAPKARNISPSPSFERLRIG